MPSDLGTFSSLFESSAPAVLGTRRRDGTMKLSPVWIGHVGGNFEIVIADNDLKLKHLRRDPWATLLIFETTPPFRGVQVSGEVEMTKDDLDEVRRSISARYLDDDSSRAFTEDRKGNGTVIRLADASAKTWDLSGITP